MNNNSFFSPINPSMEYHIKNGLAFFTCSPLAELDFLNHAFTTRLGGISKREFASLNLGLKTTDNKENIQENYRLLGSALDIKPENFIFSNQTHSLNVHIASYQDKNRGLENPLPYDEIDALITDEKELALVIVHADCVPILMVDPENKIIGAAHAGWKGSAGNILQVLVDNFINHYGSKAENLLAAIGPCIGGCCYEVGADVANQFRYLQEETNDKIIIPQKGNKFLLNLPQANRRHLLNAGLQNKNIHLSGLCTQCYNDLFFSHRQQEGKRGLLASIIQIKA